ncbi:pentatricopeptide repeat-containing protein At4g21190 isoform X2 [Prosopis cineraria]|uniref:pentatricopeptide repeat-containing protein At4g21190 isoform X2 n=1 Tax=Prosopis cineraria TaxID=364024 RepID=UPI002410335F|nr:pentatricopeptide repeat-containing protein At4g21190 isoform X2 [Prosopis cineraria]
MLALTDSPFFIIKTFEPVKIMTSMQSTVVCAAKGPRPRYPRVWKTKRKIGTISKAAKLVQRVTKWMLSKGQGRTMGSYFTLLNALAEDDRLDEAEELWTKLLMQHMESLPRRFFDKMISIYYKRGMQKKMFEIFADMEELGIQPLVSTVKMVGNVFQELGMLDKYQKLNKKYPPPTWECRYIKGKRVRIKINYQGENNRINENMDEREDDEQNGKKSKEGLEQRPDEIHDEFPQDTDVIYDETERM